jgi:hypothetical protein
MNTHDAYLDVISVYLTSEEGKKRALGLLSLTTFINMFLGGNKTM